jgi:hypothetical protein
MQLFQGPVRLNLTTATHTQLLVATPHDGCTFTFVGDILPGQQIEMAVLPPGMFRGCENIMVRSVAQTMVAGFKLASRGV